MEVILGILVSILSAMVMILIGWQIYATIEAKNGLKKIETIKEMIDREIDRLSLMTCASLSDFYYHLNTNEQRDIKFKYILYSTSATLHASKMKNLDACDAHIDAILQTNI